MAPPSQCCTLAGGGRGVGARCGYAGGRAGAGLAGRGSCASALMSVRSRAQCDRGEGGGSQRGDIGLGRGWDTLALPVHRLCVSRSAPVVPCLSVVSSRAVVRDDIIAVTHGHDPAFRGRPCGVVGDPCAYALNNTYNTYMHADDACFDASKSPRLSYQTRLTPTPDHTTCQESKLGGLRAVNVLCDSVRVRAERLAPWLDGEYEYKRASGQTA